MHGTIFAVSPKSLNLLLFVLHAVIEESILLLIHVVLIYYHISNGCLCVLCTLAWYPLSSDGVNLMYLFMCRVLSYCRVICPFRPSACCLLNQR